MQLELTKVGILPKFKFLASCVGPSMSTSPDLFIFINIADTTEKRTALFMLWLKG